jgi:hypothetical protein
MSQYLVHEETIFSYDKALRKTWQREVKRGMSEENILRTNILELTSGGTSIADTIEEFVKRCEQNVMHAHYAQWMDAAMHSSMLSEDEAVEEAHHKKMFDEIYRLWHNRDKLNNEEEKNVFDSYLRFVLTEPKNYNIQVYYTLVSIHRRIMQDLKERFKKEFKRSPTEQDMKESFDYYKNRIVHECKQNPAVNHILPLRRVQAREDQFVNHRWQIGN